jgi:HlyD family secretion protein
VVTYPVRLRADNPDRALLPGMTATVRVKVGEVQDALAVREAALRFTPDSAEPAPPRSRVFRQTAAGKVEAVPVTAGLSDGVYTEVTPVAPAVLAAGDQVLVGRLQGGSAAAGRGAPGVALGQRK